MLDIEIFRYGDPLNPPEPRVWDRWMGWEFSGGDPTVEENLALLGTTPEMMFASQSVHN
jgi:hypothetical protein